MPEINIVNIDQLKKHMIELLDIQVKGKFHIITKDDKPEFQANFAHYTPNLLVRSHLP